MPEAPVHEYDHPLFAEGEIRSSQKRGVPPPSGDAGCTQQFCQRKLGLFVTALANTRHELGAFGLNQSHTIRANTIPYRG